MLKSLRSISWRDIMAVGTVVVAAAALAATRVADPDVGFHLATGREILASGAIPARNILSFTQPEHLWPIHEAVPAVLFELIYRSGGFGGLVVLKTLLVSATWTLVYLATRRLGATRVAALVAVSVAMAAASMRFTVRPQLFSGLALAAIVWVEAYRQRTSSSREQWAAAAAEALLVAVGFQLHVGAVFAVLGLGALAVGEGLCRFGRVGSSAACNSERSHWYLPGLAVVGGVLAAAVALLAYHPHGLEILLVPFQLGGSSELVEHVVEYRSPVSFPLGLTAFYWIFAAATVASLAASFRKLHPGWLIAAGGMVILSLRHIRVVDSAAILAAPVIAVALSRALEADRLRRLRRIAPVLLVALLVSAVAHRWSAVRPGSGVNHTIWPQPIFDFLDTHDIVGPAYVIDGWAGPYLGRFYPRHRAFFDPRFEAYSPQFVTGVYKAIRYGEPGWEDLLDQYGVQVVVMRYTTAGERRFQHGDPNVRQLLARDADWSLVYFDDLGEIFVRADGQFTQTARQLAIPGVDPDRMKLVGDAPRKSAAALLRATQELRASARLWLMTSVALANTGQVDLARRLLTRGARAFPDDARFAKTLGQLNAASPH